MKLIARYLIPAFIICLAVASTALAGQLEDQLIYASESGNAAGVRDALGKGANIEAREADFDMTSLMEAALNGHADIVKLLLDKGANINAKDNVGRTALILADGTNAGVVKLLLDKGANIEEKDNNGYTVLMMAAHDGNQDVVRLLLARGADPSVKDDAGDTALSMAMEAYYPGIVNMLKAAMSASAARVANPREKLNQYISELQKRSGDTDLRKRIIQLASAMTPPPAIPDKAQQALIEANALMKAAKSPGDYKLAIGKYNEVLDEAPWQGKAYYDRAMVEDAAGLYGAAKADLELYIFTKPADAAQAQQKIYKIEAQQEIQ